MPTKLKTNKIQVITLIYVTDVILLKVNFKFWVYPYSGWILFDLCIPFDFMILMYHTTLNICSFIWFNLKKVLNKYVI